MVKKTIAAIATAAVLSGALGIVATAAPTTDAPAAEEVVAGSSWSRSTLRIGGGGGVITLGSSWS